MANVIRVALPGYNALTDINLDHFSLFTDNVTDNVLIKEFSRGGATIGLNNGSPPYQITHNLGYIPFFIVFVLNPSTNHWQIIPHFQSAFSVPDYAALSDTTKLYISNFLGSTQFRWIIFYDNVIGSSGISLTESKAVIKIPRIGKNAVTEKDPNNLVFHSDLNTLKIIKEGNFSISGTGAGAYSFTHNSPAGKATMFMLYVKFPDGTTAFIPSGFGVTAKNVSTQFVTHLEMSDTQFTFNLGSYVGTYNFKYYIFEATLASSYNWTTPRPNKNVVAVAKSGFNAVNESNPDNLKFASYFNTLKYSISGNHDVNVTGNNQDKLTEFTIANTWAGTKAFIVYVNDIFAGGAGDQYAIAPHLADTASTTHEATAYMDSYNLYLKLRIKESGAFNYTAKFYYKIFKNALGL